MQQACHARHACDGRQWLLQPAQQLDSSWRGQSRTSQAADRAQPLAKLGDAAGAEESCRGCGQIISMQRLSNWPRGWQPSSPPCLLLPAAAGKQRAVAVRHYCGGSSRTQRLWPGCGTMRAWGHGEEGSTASTETRRQLSGRATRCCSWQALQLAAVTGSLLTCVGPLGLPGRELAQSGLTLAILAVAGSNAVQMVHHGRQLLRTAALFTPLEAAVARCFLPPLCAPAALTAAPGR